MKNFKLWLETDVSSPDLLTTNMDPNQTPASAEVMKTGLQPQADADSPKATDETENNDKILAIDGHIQRISEIVNDIDSDISPQLGKTKELWIKFMQSWSKIKNPSETEDSPPPEDGGLGSLKPPKDQINYMQQNQPLPEDPTQGGFAGFMRQTN